MKKLVVLSGAGMSQESGLRTFRDMGGLWEEYDVSEVATPEAWERNPELVNRFYNERRRQLQDCEPNQGHRLLAELEHDFDVHIITQNVDDLHERAGSSKVLHLHGELKKVRSSVDPNLILELDGWELKLGQKCPKGSLLRPHIVWFGEAVPAMDQAIDIASQADLFLVIGTSLNVYPAAGLVHYTPSACPLYVVDPERPPISMKGVTFIEEKAGAGMVKLKKLLVGQ
ncbi:NAD-dependent deacylase [Mangrovibacterium marinum]|uniref:NAD-dependent protein deacylase n=1 Tax=Mangrovibacterium marinum TaxID=1639118 RepID=A0A2T5C6R5_9BACT|nr:NAD-dependent deacylase [Mangrovibacterium marinum]PTN10645.1 NAD-dependent deacetylase [Mangrovibacterium marinum]